VQNPEDVKDMKMEHPSFVLSAILSVAFFIEAYINQILKDTAKLRLKRGI
jgi:hypothetical protein